MVLMYLNLLKLTKLNLLMVLKLHQKSVNYFQCTLLKSGFLMFSALAIILCHQRLKCRKFGSVIK